MDAIRGERFPCCVVNLERRQSLRRFVYVLQSRGMILDPSGFVDSQICKGLVLLDADAPEKGCGRCGRTIGTDLPFHAPNQHEQAFPVDLTLNGHIVDIFFAPERLAPVNHDLCLRGKPVEIYRGCQYDPVRLFDGRIDLLHFVLYDTHTGLGAPAAILAWLDIHFVEPEEINLV